MQGELSAIYSNLEQRVADRTRDLNIASNLSRQIIQVLDMDNLLHRMVEQTKEGFNLYGASVYLYKPETRELTLEATTDEAERQMKKAAWVISIEARPRLKDIPTVAVTSLDPESQIAKAKAAELSGFISKPINAMEFPKILARVLNGEKVWIISR